MICKIEEKIHFGKKYGIFDVLLTKTDRFFILKNNFVQKPHQKMQKTPFFCNKTNKIMFYNYISKNLHLVNFIVLLCVICFPILPAC